MTGYRIKDMTLQTNVTVEPKPLLILRPESRWDFLSFGEIFQYVDLLLTLAARDVKLRYRQTALGAAWVLFQPLLGAGLFQIVFGLLAKTPSDGVMPFVFYFAGMMAYKSFDSTISKTTDSLVGNAHLVSKVYFPRLVLPLSTIFSTLIDFGVSSVLLIFLMIFNRVPFTLALLSLPFWLLCIQLTALGVGLYAAALSVRYRDVRQVTPILVQFGLYAAPVAYPVAFALTKLPPVARPILFLNPLTGLIDAFRWSVLQTPVYSWTLVGADVLFAVVLFVLGALVFQRMEQGLADVI